MSVTGREATGAQRSGHLAVFDQRPSGPDELRVLRRRDWAAVGIVAAATFDVRGLTIGSSLANTIVFLLLALGAAADFVGVGLVALGARRGQPAAGR